MSQTKLGSMVEAWANVVIGFGINFTANWLILPAFGFTSLTLRKNFEIGLAFTVVSVARSYFLRRIFNGVKVWWNSEAPSKQPLQPSLSTTALNTDMRI